MVYMKNEQLGSDQKSQRWDFYIFPIAGKPSNVMTFVPNVVTFVPNVATFVPNGAMFVPNIAMFLINFGNVATLLPNITTLFIQIHKTLRRGDMT